MTKAAKSKRATRRKAIEECHQVLIIEKYIGRPGQRESGVRPEDLECKLTDAEGNQLRVEVTAWSSSWEPQTRY